MGLWNKKRTILKTLDKKQRVAFYTLGCRLNFAETGPFKNFAIKIIKSSLLGIPQR